MYLPNVFIIFFKINTKELTIKTLRKLLMSQTEALHDTIVFIPKKNSLLIKEESFVAKTGIEPVTSGL